jgi:hypothetical protein
MMIEFMGGQMPIWIPLVIALCLWAFWFAIAMDVKRTWSSYFEMRRYNRRTKMTMRLYNEKGRHVETRKMVPNEYRRSR